MYTPSIWKGEGDQYHSSINGRNKPRNESKADLKWQSNNLDGEIAQKGSARQALSCMQILVMGLPNKFSIKRMVEGACQVLYSSPLAVAIWKLQ